MQTLFIVVETKEAALERARQAKAFWKSCGMSALIYAIKCRDGMEGYTVKADGEERDAFTWRAGA